VNKTIGAKKFTCPMCGQPIDLDRDYAADESGKIMHESCYVQRLSARQNDPPDPSYAE
jgi:predicted nucleic acid-binding Zn ribbon protein